MVGTELREIDPPTSSDEPRAPHHHRLGRLHRLDGFQLFSGLLAVIVGPILLVTGGFPGWSAVITAAGVLVLWAQWRIVSAGDGSRRD